VDLGTYQCACLQDFRNFSHTTDDGVNFLQTLGFDSGARMLICTLLAVINGQLKQLWIKKE
jgi:hypothetical protein